MKDYKPLLIFFIFILGSCFYIKASAQVWQWSVSLDNLISDETKDHPTAFLWIPENCRHVRAVVVGQHNMIEEGIFEHTAFRKTMRDLGFAIVWVSPNFSMTFDFNKDAGKDFTYMMKNLADSSGYHELQFAPIVPIGHSALASYPWNFGAWDPSRTLAIISVHGDSPLTNLTGSGKPNPAWGNRTIEGVPGLFVMGEYEWWEDRITPGLSYVSKYPKTPIDFFADAGHGHFDYSDELIKYLSLFLTKASAYRLPSTIQLNIPVKLKSVNPTDGWLMDKWRKDSSPVAQAAPYKLYKGNKFYSSWIFDKQMADATEKYYKLARGKKPQSLGFIQNGQIVKPNNSHANYNLRFTPLADGISFHVKAFFSDSSRVIPINQHANTALKITRICGPVKIINDSTFQLDFYRMGFNNPKRSNDIWLLASNKGDAMYKSIVQQADLRFPLWNTEGEKQQIIFKPIANQKVGIKTLKLKASSTANVPVYYYVKQGPAILRENELIFTTIPPRSKFPMKVTVVAWQYGRSMQPKLQSAQPVERTFFIVK